MGQASSSEVSAAAPPLPPQPRRPKGFGLTFRSPDPAATSPLADPTTVPGSPQLEATTEPVSPEAGSPSGSGESSDAPSESRSETSSKASSAEANPLSKATLNKAMGQGVAMAGTMAHHYLTRDDLDKEALLWLADEDDQKAIGEPLAAIAGRRGGVAGSLGNPDLADALNAMVGVAVYVSKQIQRMQIIRQFRKAQKQSEERGQVWPDEAGDAVAERSL